MAKEKQVAEPGKTVAKKPNPKREPTALQIYAEAEECVFHAKRTAIPGQSES
ncbi:hypothetical protein [Paraburkholderia elongata]|uniref:Uncharacterized protein n=1 Tax=Paraburkholderia elongata TaxID=2675747 RepID=A0A972SQW2_9BURK|nr:hypothetical protein [Paraburkholderia elongata]NPT62530.1 hypothetical protein [Paraburkholderia elongata]